MFSQKAITLDVVSSEFFFEILALYLKQGQSLFVYVFQERVFLDRESFFSYNAFSSLTL